MVIVRRLADGLGERCAGAFSHQLRRFDVQTVATQLLNTTTTWATAASTMATFSLFVGHVTTNGPLSEASPVLAIQMCAVSATQAPS